MLNRVLFTTTEKSEVFPPENAKYDFSTSWLRPTAGNKLRVYCIVIDRKNHDGQSACFADFIDDPEVILAMGLKQIPPEMVKLAQAFQTAMTQASLHAIPATDGEGKDKNKSKGAATAPVQQADDLKKEEEDKKKRKREEKKLAKANAREMFATKEKGVLNKVEIGIQDIIDKEGLVSGWRLWYFLIDGTLDPSQALVRHFHENSKKHDLKATRDRMYNEQNPSLERMMIKSAKEWIEGPMQYYQATDYPIDFQNDCTEANFYSMKDYRNPAHIDHMLSYEKSCEMIKFAIPTAQDHYSDPNAYTTVGTGALQFPEGCGIRMLNMGDRRPAVLHHALLVEDERTRDKLNAAPNEQHRLRMLRASQQRCTILNRLYSDSSMDVVASSLLLNTEAFKKAMSSANGSASKETANVQKVRNSSAFKARINSLIASYTSLDPAHKACIEWIKEQQLRSVSVDKKPWSAIRVNHSKVDPGMSLFAHYSSRCLNIFENVIGFGTVHQEAQMLNMWRLCAFDSRSKALFTHMLLYGAFATSKSHLQKVIASFSVVNSFRLIGYETKKAYTDDKNYNGLLFIYDEMPSAMLDKSDGGEGDPMIKSILSDGKMKTIQMEPNPMTGRREAREYECLLKAPFWVNTNAVGPAIPDPIKSRFFMHEMVRHLRPEIDFSLKDEEMRANPKNANQTEVVEEEMRLMESLVACCELFIKAGFLPQVNQTSALLRWNLIKTELTKCGILLEPRKDSHIISLLRTATLQSAILQVFYTTDIFNEGKPFEWEDLMQLAPFLYTTEEHLIFTITTSEQCITNSNSDDVIDALLELCRKGKGKTSEFNYKEGTPEGVVGLYDYSYLSWGVPGMEPKQEEVLTRASVTLAEYIKKKTRRTYLAESIKEVLKRMLVADIEGVQHLKSVKQEENDRLVIELEARLENERDTLTPAEFKKIEEDLKQARIPVDKVVSRVSNASSFNDGQGQVSETKEQKAERIKLEKDRLESIANHKGELDSFPVMTVTLNMNQRCSLEINRDYLIGKENRARGFLMAAIETTQNKYTPRRRMVIGKTYRDKDQMVPYVYRVFDAKPNGKDAKVLNLNYKSPGSEHMFCKTDGVYLGEDRLDFILKKEEEEDEAISFLKDIAGWAHWAKKKEDDTDNKWRYQTLKMNPDVHFYKKFLKENHLTQPESTKENFPVCMTWKTDTAVYPEQMLKDASYALKDPKERVEAMIKDMNPAEFKELEDEREARKLEQFLKGKRMFPGLFRSLSQEEREEEDEAKEMDKFLSQKESLIQRASKRAKLREAGYDDDDDVMMEALTNDEGVDLG